MHMFAPLPGTPPSLSSYQRVGWSFPFQQEHWKHVKLGLAAIELSFHLRWGSGRSGGRGVGRHDPSAKACARGGPSSGRDHTLTTSHWGREVGPSRQKRTSPHKALLQPMVS